MKKKFIIYFILLALFVYIIALIRSIKMDITIDEAITYTTFVTNKWSVHSPNAANNHILNTLLILILEFITQSHYNVFIMRIPNLIFYLVYIYYTYKLSLLYKNKSVVATILLLNYSVNEFASLSRGYGIASAFIIGGIYYYKLFLKNKEDKTLKISIIYFLLASTANSSCLIPTACFLLDAIIRLTRQKKLKKMIIDNKCFLVIVVLISIILSSYHILVSLNDQWLSYAMCNQNSFDCLIVNPMNYYGFYNNNILFLCLILFTFLFFINFKNNKIEKDNIFYMVLIIFVILIICKIIFPFKMPIGRVLVPYISIYLISTFDYIKLLNQKINLKYLKILIILFFIAGFYKNISINNVREWPKKSNVKKLVEKKYKAKKLISLNEIEKNKNVFVYYYEKYKFYYNYKLMKDEEYYKIYQ